MHRSVHRCASTPGPQPSLRKDGRLFSLYLYLSLPLLASPRLASPILRPCPFFSNATMAAASRERRRVFSSSFALLVHKLSENIETIGKIFREIWSNDQDKDNGITWGWNWIWNFFKKKKNSYLEVTKERGFFLSVLINRGVVVNCLCGGKRYCGRRQWPQNDNNARRAVSWWYFIARISIRGNNRLLLSPLLFCGREWQAGIKVYSSQPPICAVRNFWYFSNE